MRMVVVADVDDDEEDDDACSLRRGKMYLDQDKPMAYDFFLGRLPFFGFFLFHVEEAEV